MIMHLMSFKVRVFHAVLFEIFGVVFVTFGVSSILHLQTTRVLSLSIIVSIIAMLWNFIYNIWFDKLEVKLGGSRMTRRPLIRIFHTCVFEGGLIIVTLPLITWWLNMTLVHAFTLDISLVVFFLFYTYLFNWTFDRVYFRIVSRK